jgi:ribosomal protein S18 acetylase RimI-like enzyme
MYATMYAAGTVAGKVIDNSHQSPDETARAILDHIDQFSRAAQPASQAKRGPAFTLTEQPAPADVAFVRQRIREFNDVASRHHRLARPSGKTPLAAFMRDEAGQLIGGLVASIYWDWLDIDELWVAASWRGQGHGRTLLRMAEAAASQRSCRWVQVKSWDFQAKAFYQRFGYRVAGEMADYPPGCTFYWLRKALPG